MKLNVDFAYHIDSLDFQLKHLETDDVGATNVRRRLNYGYQETSFIHDLGTHLSPQHGYLFARRSAIAS